MKWLIVIYLSKYNEGTFTQFNTITLPNSESKCKSANLFSPSPKEGFQLFLPKNFWNKAPTIQSSLPLNSQVNALVIDGDLFNYLVRMKPFEFLYSWLRRIFFAVVKLGQIPTHVVFLITQVPSYYGVAGGFDGNIYKQRFVWKNMAFILIIFTLYCKFVYFSLIQVVLPVKVK